MSGAIIVDQIRDVEIISEQTEQRGMIRLEQIVVTASGGKTWQIGEEQEHHTQREDLYQKRKENCSEKIRAES